MLDFELDLPDSRPGAAGFDLGGDDDEDSRTLALGRGASGELDEIQTKLDLAQAYIDMEDIESARGILGEVMAEGSELQKDQARLLLSRIN